MGTRNFSQVEEQDSRIKWKKADPATAQKLAAAIPAYNGREALVKTPAKLVVYLSTAILLVLLAVVLITAKDSDRPLVILIPGVASILFVAVFLLARYRKAKSYLSPEKQAGIWIFRAKCSDMPDFGAFDRDRRYYPIHFQKGGAHICIYITAWEYKQYKAGKMAFIGKEFVFYKFNDKTGNPWKAVPAELLQEDLGTLNIRE